jgi:hypothetical protein
MFFCENPYFFRLKNYFVGIPFGFCDTNEYCFRMDIEVGRARISRARVELGIFGGLEKFATQVWLKHDLGLKLC